MEHRKPCAVSRKLDPAQQAALMHMRTCEPFGRCEAVLFGDAVHPTHAVRPVGCWGPDTQVAVEQTSGRQRLNIHGAIWRPAGPVLEVATVDAAAVMLLMAVEAMYPGKPIHLFVDNARYHHKLVQAWLARSERVRLIGQMSASSLCLARQLYRRASTQRVFGFSRK